MLTQTTTKRPKIGWEEVKNASPCRETPTAASSAQSADPAAYENLDRPVSVRPPPPTGLWTQYSARECAQCTQLESRVSSSECSRARAAKRAKNEATAFRIAEHEARIQAHRTNFTQARVQVHQSRSQISDKLEFKHINHDQRLQISSNSNTSVKITDFR